MNQTLQIWVIDGVVVAAVSLYEAYTAFREIVLER
jgi:hypothetical protein